MITLYSTHHAAISFTVANPLAVLSALVLYVHLLCDVAWDIVRFRRRADTSLRQLAD
ncbi:hypothetical protein ACYJ1Y_16715 [Natrialbaceae archaeon A-gly3]